MKVYKCINQVQAQLAKTGISKDQRNSQQGYNFRGIDNVYNALAPLLADNGLCILPEVIERSVTEKTSKTGSILFYVVVLMRFHFVAAEDNSIHIVSMYGEAMDSGDKATNKAMSAAYKYACMQTFCIPTEGDNDADATTHIVTAEETVPQLTTYQKVVVAITQLETERARTGKGTSGKDIAKTWCDFYNVQKLSELNAMQLIEVLKELEEKLK